MKAPKYQDNPKKKAEVKPTSMTTNSGIAKANAEDKDRAIRYYENPDYLIKNKVGRTGYWNEFQKYLQDYTLPNGEKYIQNEQVNKGTSNEYSDKAMADYKASLIKKYGEGHPNVDRLAITPEDVKQVQTYYNQGDPNFKVDARIGGETSQLRYPTLTKADVKVAEGTYAPVMYGKKQYLAPADKYNSGNFTNDLVPYNPSLDSKIDPNALKTLGTYTTQTSNQQTSLQQKAKGGIVQKLFGGGRVRGDANGDGVVDAKEQDNLNSSDKAKGAIGGALGGVGAGYYNSKVPTSEGDSARSAGLAAASQSGAIGGVIGGIASIGDKIGARPKANAEQVDVTTGELKNEGKAKSMAGLGIALSPSKRLTYAGGLTDVTGQGYIKSIEDKTKSQLNKVNIANRNAKMSQLIQSRNAQEENPMLQNAYDTSGATFDANHNLILANGQQLAKGGLVGKVKQMCAKGGVIKGEGGPKDDKITAKVEADSFVVPADKAKVAESLRATLLRKAPKAPANLNQKGGEKVKLSNGEHLFTPEEKEELMEKGVNVNALAPDAENKEEMMEKKSHIMFPKFADGGTVDPAKELAKIEAERKAIEAIKAKKESDQTAAEKARLQKFILEARATNQSNKVKEWEKKYTDAKTKLDALNKSYEDASKEFKAGSTPSANQKGVKAGIGTESQRKYKEDLLKKIQEAKVEHDNAKRTYDYVKSGKTFTPPTDVKTTTPKVEAKTSASESVVENKPANKPSLKAPKATKPATDYSTGIPTKDVVVSELSKDNAARNLDATDVVDANIAKQAPISTTAPTTNRVKPKGNGILNKIGNVDPTAFIGIGQTALGLNMLRNEKRPTYNPTLDPTYNAAVNRAQDNAKFGLTPEQQFAAKQDIQGGLNDAKFTALNTSGGNGVQAFNTNRAAINDAWRQRLGLKQADFDTRMQKQKYADEMAADRASILAANRKDVFNNAMNTFQQKQGAGSELIGAGLANTIGAYRFRQDQEARRKADEARGYSLDNYNPTT